MGQTQTALLAISTALDEGNHYSALTKLEDKETGEPLFNVIRVGMVCEACAKTTTPWLCNHKAYDVCFTLFSIYKYTKTLTTILDSSVEISQETESVQIHLRGTQLSHTRIPIRLD